MNGSSLLDQPTERRPPDADHEYEQEVTRGPNDGSRAQAETRPELGAAAGPLGSAPLRRWSPQPQRVWDWSAMRAICLREAQRVLGPSASAEDAAQEAMVRAWRRQNTCHTPERPHAWITTIARREALRHVRRPREACLDDLPAGAHPRSRARGWPGAGRDRSPSDRGPGLRGSLAGARSLLARPLRRELADDLGLAEPTVRVRLHRLRSSLKEALTEAMNSTTTIDDARYVKAMSHPLRVTIMALLEERSC